MGLESAIYVYIPASQSSMVHAFEAIDAVPLNLKEGKYKVNVSDCWIDILKRDTISLRLVYTNPLEETCRELRRVMERLLIFGGTINDMQSKKSFEYLDDHTWNFVWEHYLHNRERFINRFGDLVLSISADEIYDFIFLDSD